MDLAEDSDLEEGLVLAEEWDLDFEGALPPGLMLVWEGEGYQGAAISLVEYPGHLWHGRISRLLILLVQDLVPGRLHIHSTLGHLWRPCRERHPLLGLLLHK